jgi:hypothetical protein
MLQTARELKSNFRVVFKDNSSSRPVSPLLQIWTNYEYDTIRHFYRNLFFVGHDDRPFCNLEYLYTLPELTKTSTGRRATAEASTSGAAKGNETLSSTAEASTSGAAKGKEKLSSVAKEEEVEDGQEESWSKHMSWCNNHGKRLITSFENILNNVREGALPNEPTSYFFI